MTEKIPSYPKIFALGNRCIKDIFQGEVEITEKIDGSHFAFGKINGKLHMRSKNQPLYIENIDNDKMFSAAMHHVKSIEHLLPDGTIFYCEYLSRPKHNILAYDRTPKNHLVLFAIYDIATQSFNRFALKSWANDLDIEVVSQMGMVYRNDGINFDLDYYLKITSILGGQLIEGIVIKNYSKDLLVGGQYIPIMCGKYVSESFKEVHQRTWKYDNCGKSQWEVYKEGFRTEARWNKGIQHLIESGDITYDPRDIGKLIVEVQKDVAAEETENIKDKLWDLYGKEVLRTSIHGLPEYYKKWLADSANANIVS